MSKEDEIKNIGENGKKKENEPLVKCPDCGDLLQKCLIQQNYAMVICPNEKCEYPFNQHEIADNLVYVDDNDILEVARLRLSKK
ncbi:uncharacterized protein PWA37_003307 [Arxiozyma heterogenica]|uniref:Uncharacterized protein n=1 Tax=Arxiozyma heterogenica TaxID=278026 RepID=A0AAN8A961_9SACH|nr:hypothetical protein RI543_001782 [Kazachstania heterogenica]